MNNVCWGMGRGVGRGVGECGKVWEEVWGSVRQVWKIVLGCGGG